MEIRESGYSTGIKLFLTTVLIAGLFLSFWACISYIQTDRLYHLIVVVLPLFLFCIIGLWHTYKFKLIVTNKLIESKGLFKSKILYFDTIQQVYLYENEMILKGGRVKIRVTSDLQHQKETISYLISILKNHTGVKVSGDKKIVDAIFGKASL